MKLGTHHGMSMSRWNVWAVCPHFQSDDKPREEASEGTLAHEDVARIYSEAESAEEAISDKFTAKYPQSKWCAGEWLKLAKCEDMLDSAGFDVRCGCEMRLQIRNMDPLIDGIHGFTDFVRIVRKAKTGELDRITIADFKTFSDGKQVYDEQLAGYAVAVASTLPDAHVTTPVELYTAHGAVQRLTLTNTTLGECLTLSFDIIRKRLGRGNFPKVANKHCKYCKYCPCNGAIAEVKAVVPQFPTLDLTPEGMMKNVKNVPMILAVIEDAQRVIDTVRESARTIIKTQGKHEVSKNGLDVWTLGDERCSYAIKTQAGRKVIAENATNNLIIEMLGEGGIKRFTQVAKIGVKDFVQAYADANEGMSVKDAEKKLVDTGYITHGKPIEKMERVG